MMTWLIPYLATAAHWLIVVGLTLRIVMRRPPHGVALAWLLLIVLIPLGGAVLYFLVGERRIGEKRSKSIAALRTDFRQILDAVERQSDAEIQTNQLSPSVHRLDRLGRNLAACPTVRGNSLNLLGDTEQMLAAIARDVDAAKKSVLMEFYIWNEGGGGDEVLEAVIRAAKRGIPCRLLIDAIGARPWWKRNQPRRLREAGVQIVPALPVGLFRTLVGRTDLRLHRKIVVVDGEVAWTGSMNLVDPRYFKQDAGVGQWVDALTRVEGPVVAVLAATFVRDWLLETRETPEQIVQDAQLEIPPPRGSADIQVFPSGPGETDDGLLQMIIETINSANTELTLTTPYLVPDESLLRAIRLASGRGVRVRLIVPERVDSFLTRYASRSYFDDLLQAGVEIYLFRAGLLHTKSILADRTVAMFGTVNLDMRSLWLNYEVAMFISDSSFAEQLHQLHESYLSQSSRLTDEKWRGRSYSARLMENTMRLMSPLL